MTALPTERRIEQRPLSSLRPNPRNPKAHADDLIDASIERFGYIEPVSVDERTDYLISGHGRIARLTERKQRGEAPPDGVSVDEETGDWLIPTVVGWASKDDQEAEAALVALNRLTERGGWDSSALLAVLDNLAESQSSLLDVIGYGEADLDLLKRIADAETAFTVDQSGAIDEFLGLTGLDGETVRPQYFERLVVHFQDEAARDDFCQRLGLSSESRLMLRWPTSWKHAEAMEPFTG